MEGLQTEVWDIARGQVSSVRCDGVQATLRESIVGIHLSTREEVAERLLKNDVLLSVSRCVRQLRAFGSGQLALAHVASGRLQVFFQLDTYIWDQVAGVVLVKNAGGSACDLGKRRDWHYMTKDILATANAELKDNFLTLWRGLPAVRGSKKSRRRTSP